MTPSSQPRFPAARYLQMYNLFMHSCKYKASLPSHSYVVFPLSPASSFCFFWVYICKKLIVYLVSIFLFFKFGPHGGREREGRVTTRLAP